MLLLANKAIVKVQISTRKKEVRKVMFLLGKKATNRRLVSNCREEASRTRLVGGRTTINHVSTLYCFISHFSIYLHWCYVFTLLHILLWHVCFIQLNIWVTLYSIVVGVLVYIFVVVLALTY